MEKLYLQRLEA